MGDPRLPKRRLDHVSKLQWELDAWLQHAINFQITMPDVADAKLQKQIDAFETASAVLFNAFGQPDGGHKA